MTSKEALELLELILLNHSSMLVINDKRFEYFNVIKERLEVLEQENKELKETIEIRKQMNINLIDFGTKLKQENEKLKKAIEKHIGMLESLNSKVPRLKRIDICDCLEELIDRLNEVIINE